MINTPIQPVAFPISGAVIYSGLSRSRLYSLIGSGELSSFTVGGRRMIYRAALDAYLAKQSDAA